MAAHSSFNTTSIRAQPRTACFNILFDFSLEAFWDYYYFAFALGRIQMQISSESFAVLYLGARASLSANWFLGCFGKIKDVTWEWPRRGAEWKKGVDAGKRKRIGQGEKSREGKGKDSEKQAEEPKRSIKNPLDRQNCVHLSWQYFVNSCLHATDTIIEYNSHNPQWELIEKIIRKYHGLISQMLVHIQNELIEESSTFSLSVKIRIPLKFYRIWLRFSFFRLIFSFFNEPAFLTSI